MESKPDNHEDAACERCGSFDVVEIAGQFLCGECVATAGCGCAGHDLAGAGKIIRQLGAEKVFSAKQLALATGKLKEWRDARGQRK